MQAHQARPTQPRRQDVLIGISPIASVNDMKREIFAPYARKEIVGPYSTIDPKAMRMLEIHRSKAYTGTRQRARIQIVLLSWFFKSVIQERTKRAFDLIISFLLMPFVLPIMFITALAVKLDSPGPILFKQERVGKWGKKFYCFKFRSMVIDAEARKKELLAMNEADGVVFKMKHDPRVTRVGRVIRKLSIDELPQIFNVIKGDMSLVGPRPPVPHEVAQYQFDHFRRLDAMPGITGLQQVTGRTGISFSRWVELDVQYIQEQSLGKDIEIILKTVPAVITSRGAY
jgi:lipopolysaccharide/colanic/teichoic acid biosynthesis glycosyltransferase